jgi:hypothetical protein
LNDHSRPDELDPAEPADTQEPKPLLKSSSSLIVE